ncbi:MAG: thiolase family protein [Deltaproteobacteria bacterium]|nr:thiolase family protein [Deltaproteobacteria bacterium]
MREVALVGAGMTRFAKHLDRSMKDLARESIDNALRSANINASALEAAAVGNAMAGLITGQECIRGQVVLREMGIGGIPVINTENACASAATAFHIAWLYVASGMYDVVLAVGMEKLFHQDKSKSFEALGSAIDVELMQQTLEQMKTATNDGGEDAGAGKSRSMFMDFYADFARAHMREYGTTKEHFAKIAAKNHTNGSLNPHAQFQTPRTMEDILASPMIADPLTRMMCSPIGDGAAAVILTSAERAKQYTAKPVYVRASVLGSGKDRKPGEPEVTERVARKAYEMAGLGPQDIHVAEVHDASAPAELIIYEELGFCKHGEGGRLIDEGATLLGGRLPVNPSGGLLAKGHPVGATGVAQIAEIFWQLRGEAGKRQVQGAKVGLTENGGGMLRGEAAAVAVHILTV